jgi:hypothetical protein
MLAGFQRRFHALKGNPAFAADQLDKYVDAWICREKHWIVEPSNRAQIHAAILMTGAGAHRGNSHRPPATLGDVLMVFGQQRDEPASNGSQASNTKAERRFGCHAFISR